MNAEKFRQALAKTTTRTQLLKLVREHADSVAGKAGERFDAFVDFMEDDTRFVIHSRARHDYVELVEIGNYDPDKKMWGADRRRWRMEFANNRGASAISDWLQSLAKIHSEYMPLRFFSAYRRPELEAGWKVY